VHSVYGCTVADIATDIARSVVCLAACVSVSCGKTAEQIVSRLGVHSRGGSNEPCNSRGPDPPWEGHPLGGRHKTNWNIAKPMRKD